MVGRVVARPRSPDKRDAILAAAARGVALEGEGVAISQIAQLAGVAQGTVFVYFENKDELLNQLYLHLKGALLFAMNSGFPRGASREDRGRHLWNSYVGFGLAHTAEQRAMRQLGVSERIRPETRAQSAQGFAEFAALLREILGSDEGDDERLAFAGAVFDALAEVTVQFATLYPERADRYRSEGFEGLLRALRGFQAASATASKGRPRMAPRVTKAKRKRVR
jgi:AcrR family transcriptional regulator